MAYGNNAFGGLSQPSNNLWVGNNYSTGYNNQMPKNNFNYSPIPQSSINQNMNNSPLNNIFQVIGPESAQAYQLPPDAQISITLNGSVLPETTAKTVTAVAGDLINVSGSTFIKVPCVNNLTFSVLLTNTGTTELNIDANTRLSIKRIA